MRTKLLFIAFIASYVFFSCSNDDDGEFEPSSDIYITEEGDTIYYDSVPYFGTRIIPINKCIINYLRPPQEALCLVYKKTFCMMFGVGIGVRGGVLPDEDAITLKYKYIDEKDIFEGEEGYDEYSKFYGDTTFCGTYNVDFSSYPVFGGAVFRFPLEGLEVTALTDYNENHPANSSLHDIAVMRYTDMVDYIKNGYIFATPVYTDVFWGKRRPDEISKENPIKLLSIANGSGFIEMLEKPTPGKHAVQVKLTFGADPVSGETVDPIVLECEFEYTLEEE